MKWTFYCLVMLWVAMVNHKQHLLTFLTLDKYTPFVSDTSIITLELWISSWLENQMYSSSQLNISISDKKAKYVNWKISGRLNFCKAFLTQNSLIATFWEQNPRAIKIHIQHLFLTSTFQTMIINWYCHLCQSDVRIRLFNIISTVHVRHRYKVGMISIL